MKLPDDPQMSLSSRALGSTTRALGRGCRGPSRRSSGPRPGDRSRSRGSAPEPSGPHRSASPPMPIPTRARTSALGGYVTGHGVSPVGCGPSLSLCSSRPKRSSHRLIPIVWSSPARPWRRLRRGSQRPAAWLTAIRHLVESSDHLRPRREVHTRHHVPAIVTLSATAKALTPTDGRTGGPKLDGHGRHGDHGETEGGCRCRGHGGHGAHGGPCPPPGA
jgi:hypothetical protein